MILLPSKQQRDLVRLLHLLGIKSASSLMGYDLEIDDLEIDSAYAERLFEYEDETDDFI